MTKIETEVSSISVEMMTIVEAKNTDKEAIPHQVMIGETTINPGTEKEGHLVTTRFETEGLGTSQRKKSVFALIHHLIKKKQLQELTTF